MTTAPGQLKISLQEQNSFRESGGLTSVSGQSQESVGGSAVLELLQKVPLFQFLGPQELTEVAPHLALQIYDPGQTIFSKDDPGTTLHIIAAGVVKIFLPAEGGEEAPLGMLKAGDYFGELALLDGAQRTASAAAMARTATLTLERDVFIDFITSHPLAASAVFRAMASLIRKQNLQLFGEFFQDK